MMDEDKLFTRVMLLCLLVVVFCLGLYFIGVRGGSSDDSFWQTYDSQLMIK